MWEFCKMKVMFYLIFFYEQTKTKTNKQTKRIYITILLLHQTYTSTMSNGLDTEWKTTWFVFAYV